MRTDESGQTLVAAVNAEIMVSVPGRPELEPIAAEAKDRLQEVLTFIAECSVGS